VGAIAAAVARRVSDTEVIDQALAPHYPTRTRLKRLTGGHCEVHAPEAGGGGGGGGGGGAGGGGGGVGGLSPSMRRVAAGQQLGPLAVCVRRVEEMTISPGSHIGGARINRVLLLLSRPNLVTAWNKPAPGCCSARSTWANTPTTSTRGTNDGAFLNAFPLRRRRFVGGSGGAWGRPGGRLRFGSGHNGSIVSVRRSVHLRLQRH